MTNNEKLFYIELKRQFGKKDASMFLLSPEKYKHHFDGETLKAYENFLAK